MDRVTNRIAWLDVGRGAAILLVIFWHASMLTQNLVNIHRVHWIVNDFFAPVRMPLFFTISGLVGAKVVSASWSQVVGKRVLTLWYVYAVWVAIGLIIDFIVGRTVGVPDLFLSAIWPSSTLWYLWVLGFYFILARLFRGSWQLPFWGAATIASVLTEGQFFRFDALEHSKAVVYAPFFLGGAWYARSILKLTKHEWILFLVAGAGFVCLFFALRWNLMPPSVRFAASVLGLLTGMSGAIIISRLPFVGSALAYCGRNTLPVYVSHFLILKMLVFIALSVGIAALPGFNVWGALVASGTALGLSLSIGRIVKDYNAMWLFQLPPLLVTRSPIMLQRPVSSVK